MRKPHHLILFVLTCLVISSCSIENRLYTKGYHIDWLQKNTSSKKSDQTIATAADEHQIKPTSNTALKDSQPVEQPEADIASSRPMVEAQLNIHPVEPSAIAQTHIPSGASAIDVSSHQGAETKVSAADVIPTNKKLKRKLLRKFADETILYVILALLLPPLAVFLYEGKNWTDRCTLNLILTILCWLPGVIHALLVILDNR